MGQLLGSLSGGSGKKWESLAESKREDPGSELVLGETVMAVKATAWEDEGDGDTCYFFCGQKSCHLLLS